MEQNTKNTENSEFDALWVRLNVLIGNTVENITLV